MAKIGRPPAPLQPKPEPIFRPHGRARFMEINFRDPDSGKIRAIVEEVFNVVVSENDLTEMFRRNN